MEKRKWYYIIAFILILFMSCFIISFFLFLPPAGIDRSSYSTTPEGSKAAFMLFKKLGYNVCRWEKSFHSLYSDGILIILEPYYKLQEEEVFMLQNWIKRGNTLIFFSEDKNLLYKEWNIDLKKAKSSGVLQPLQPSSLIEGVNNVQFYSLLRMEGTIPDMVEYFGDPEGALMLNYPFGKGQIVFISDSTILSNKGIGNMDNAVLISNILMFYGGKTSGVYFDDYHHGYRTEPFSRKDTLIAWLPNYFKLIFLQILFALFIFLFARSLRFGSVLPLEKSTFNRSASEFVISMANLFQRAGARREIIAQLYEGFKRDFIRRLGIKGHEDYNEIARRVSERTGLESEHLVKLMEIVHLKSGNITEKELFIWYKDMRRYRKELE
ncbi:MAG TPA: DUF4350 domain-containing protein [Candidatus Eremiobacteraeota bacterium]|nr:DUF4350 domain-containing protein [Candidatus Eremiobacteraeota bacterium]